MFDGVFILPFFKVAVFEALTDTETIDGKVYRCLNISA
jgi:hypothetical protein